MVIQKLLLWTGKSFLYIKVVRFRFCYYTVNNYTAVNLREALGSRKGNEVAGFFVFSQ